MSLRDIARDTNISKRFLGAIEEEDFKKLPGIFFVKGFIKTYADYLGLDPQAVLKNYRDVFETGEEKDHESFIGHDFKKHSIALATAGNRKNFWPAIVGFLFLAGMGFYFRDYVSVNGRIMMDQGTGRLEKKELVRQENPKPANEQESVPPLLPENSMSWTPKEGDAQSMSLLSPLPEPANDEAPAAEEGKTLPGKTGNESSGQSTGESEKTAEALLNPPMPSSPPRKEETELILKMKARAEAWIRIQIDSQEDWKDFILKEGEQMTFKAHERFSLSTGNARAVELSLNDQTVPWPQDKAVIRDFILTRPKNRPEEINDPSKPPEDGVRDLQQ